MLNSLSEPFTSKVQIHPFRTVCNNLVGDLFHLTINLPVTVVVVTTVRAKVTKCNRKLNNRVEMRRNMAASENIISENSLKANQPIFLFCTSVSGQ
jgi:hypothetical protein